MSRFATFAVLTLTFAASAAAAAPPGSENAAGAEYFEAKVRPLLAERCFSCHGEKRQQAGLRLDSKAALAKGSDAGPVVLPGDPDKSPLIKAVRYGGEVKMPPKGKLSDEAVETLTAWVKMGAPYPDAPATATKTTAVAEVRKSHWAFQPIRHPHPPAVKDAAWIKTPVDRFILARLEGAGLTPSPAAERRTLIRRVTFDLLGLPPTPEEVEAFVRDPSPDAFAQVVDRLLADSRYGERWARFWLDVARYADTKGYVFMEERRYPYAYTYRDYVVRAFNDDLPYDRFLTEQLAADRLDLGGDKRPLAAMGFLTLGRRFLNSVPDIIDDRIDVVSRGLLGLTVACARCHDHKFDPIPTKDYYSLYGVFASSVEPRELPLLGMPEQSEAYQAFEAELKKRQEVVEKFREEHKAELASGNRQVRNDLRELQKKVDQWQASSPAAPPRAMVLQDAPTPQTPHVFLRGNPNNPGEAVPRQFLEVLAGDARRPFSDGSGRLELARAIASPDNPLTARVMVNRVWQHHFGDGLVRTPGNFGLRGEPPTHPELLDWLASTFMDDGWSVKRLHRLILLSAAYQQGSGVDPRGEQLDPENHLLWRMERRRLDFEALRDSLLAAAGRLDLRQGGPAVDLTSKPFSPRRSVYGFVDRQNLPGLFRTFDFASPDTATPQRHETTVPQQALFLMNSPFVVEQTRGLVSRPEVVAQKDDAARISYVYRLLYGRPAEPDEVELGLRFLAVAPTGSGQPTAWEKYAQVLLLANEFAFVD